MLDRDDAEEVLVEDESLPPLTEENLTDEIAGLEEDILNIECGHPMG